METKYLPIMAITAERGAKKSESNNNKTEDNNNCWSGPLRLDINSVLSDIIAIDVIFQRFDIFNLSTPRQQFCQPQRFQFQLPVRERERNFRFPGLVQKSF